VRSAAGARLAGVALLLSPSLLTAGCRSAAVMAEVRNQSGERVRLLEVEYPSASFGRDVLEPGESLRHRLQIQGSGRILVSYTDAGGHGRTAKGPELDEGQQGTLAIEIGSGGQVRFDPHLSTPR
jgi:hypothetical protein